MYGNNEVGTIQPIAEIGQLLNEHQAIFHTDAVQAYGIENIDVNEVESGFISVSAHKINGPKGIGFLYARSRCEIFTSSYLVVSKKEKDEQELKMFRRLLDFQKL